MKTPPSLIPELIVSNLSASLIFWRDLVGFQILHERPEEGFVYLALGNAHLMLEQQNLAGRDWASAALEKPFGRGINFEIQVIDIGIIIERTRQRGVEFFLPPEERWYRHGQVEVGQYQCIISDPDGYLVRLMEKLGERSAAG